MADQDTARTIIFDLVQLEKLGAELERRYRINPTTRVADVLTHIAPEDHILYLPQLNRLLEGLVTQADQGNAGGADDTSTIELPNAGPDSNGDVGESLHRSLLATAILEDSNQGGSKPASSKLVSSKLVSSDSTAKKDAVPERIDQFRILRELGAGAFGVVYLAEDESLQRKVAIKVPKVSDAASSASYINEARKAAAIDCVGIVPIYHVGSKDNGVPFVVQKLIDGPTLRLLLSRYGSLPPAHAVTLMRDVATALSSAHRLGIYHRDLKPDNILIDSSGVPWIADFGLAISESEQSHRKGEVAGTLMYMSPEQIQGRADWLDGRSDIWALGIMLHELLLGKPPFSGKNRQSLMEQICHREPRPLQQSSPELNLLNEVFTKCCAKSPSDRYSSAEELSHDLNILINQGLSTLPIDGSELHFEKPISRYASHEGNSSRTATQSGRGSTLSAAGQSTSPLSGSVGSSSQPTSVHGPASGTSGPEAVSQQSVASSKSNQRKGLTVIGVGIASIIVLGTQQWFTRTSIPSQASVVEATIPIAPVVEPIEPDKVKTSESIPEETANQAASADSNSLSLSEADGSENRPWIVALDGSGSHRTIGDAVTASQRGAFIQIKPGIYSEFIMLTQPMNLIGLGEPDQCIISSAEASPIEIANAVGTVNLANLSIRGNAIQSGKAFNSIELTSGKLRMNQCLVRSSTQNGVKLRPGASLEAVNCKFLESNAFAVSGLNHISLKVTDCEFLQSGVQAVGGPAQIQDSTFQGVEGVYVGQSGETPSTISNCDFLGCFEYGVEVTDGGDAVVENSRFTNCKFGVQVANSNAVVRGCEFTASGSAGLDLQGGRLRVIDDTVIRESKKFGCLVSGGTLELSSVQFANIADAGVAAEGVAHVKIEDTNFLGCGSFAVEMIEGTLDLLGGTIERCKEAGVYLSEKSTAASLVGTQFINNPGEAMIIKAGEVICKDIRVTRSDTGLVIWAEGETVVNVTLRGASFEEIIEFAIEIVADEGTVNLDVFASDFGNLPISKQIQKQGANAKVNLHL